MVRQAVHEVNRAARRAHAELQGKLAPKQPRYMSSAKEINNNNDQRGEDKEDSETEITSEAEDSDTESDDESYRDIQVDVKHIRLSSH